MTSVETGGVVIDTSAAVAILTGEMTATGVIAALDHAERRVMSAATLVELGIVLEARFGPVGGAVAERFLREGDIEVLPVDREVAVLAIAAWRRFGRGHHQAALSYGDCFTYATAALLSVPVLCVGGDFPATDLPVLPIA